MRKIPPLFLLWIGEKNCNDSARIVRSFLHQFLREPGIVKTLIANWYHTQPFYILYSKVCKNKPELLKESYVHLINGPKLLIWEISVQNFWKKIWQTILGSSCIYRTRVIITRGLYIFYSIFEDHFFVSRRFFKKIISLCKVHIFWEGHKILRNLHQSFVLCTASQIIGGDFAKFCGLLRI